ncbi:MAG: hypothetical protein HY985_13490 [Magnetospirillum sp.]|nr:hypothetical protein [Magnetospirillum sp.]
MFGGSVMMGAQERLIPPSIPFRFFLAATLYHVAAWAMLLAGAEQLPGFTGGLGPLVAALHLLTLGVLAMTAMGAAYQLLPVATRRPLGPAWACRLSWWLYTPGVALLSAGLYGGSPAAMHGGGTLVVAGLAVFGVLVAGNLRRTTDLPAVVAHTRLALAALAGVAVLGLVLVIDVGTGLLPDRGAVAAAHAVLGGYGFMGSLGLGFSYVLVPMFVLSQGVPDAPGKRGVGLWALALLLGVGGAASGMRWAAAAGALVALVAVALHLRLLARVLKTRMKKRLEPFFRLVKGAWVLLPASLLAGVALAVGAPAEVAAPLWAVLLVPGWLLTFVTGVLQRIMPFLASMHSGGASGKPILLSRLIAPLPLTVHAVAHGTALALLTAGAILGNAVLVQAAAGIGLAGALAFVLFAALVLKRWRDHERGNNG